ncbi:hypothetical protein QZH41_010460, partial [Actinostola sp. cb2023]
KASQVPWHISETKAVVQYGQSRPDHLLYPPRSGYLWSTFTRPVFQGFAHARSNLVTDYGSFWKGHRVFRLMRKGEIHGPLFAFLGFVCTDIGVKSSSTKEEEKDFQKLYQWMQKGIQSSQKELRSTQNQNEEHHSLKLADYNIRQRLGERSCNSAVYAATRNENKFAVKMLFNFNTNSNSNDLKKAFSKEQQVLSIDPKQDEESRYTNISPHPNILPVMHSFVDDVPCLPDAEASYPAALPPKYTHNGLGRNKTMFMVMPRYQTVHCTYIITTNLLAQFVEYRSVITAQCGDGAIIDYSKSDAWAAGAIAYELFGQRNPFGRGGLDSSSYRDKDLPGLTRAPDVVRWVVKKLLHRNHRDRLSARDASTILHVSLFAPSWWLRDKFLVTQGQILRYEHLGISNGFFSVLLKPLGNE